MRDNTWRYAIVAAGVAALAFLPKGHSDHKQVALVSMTPSPARSFAFTNELLVEQANDERAARARIVVSRSAVRSTTTTNKPTTTTTKPRPRPTTTITTAAPQPIETVPTDGIRWLSAQASFYGPGFYGHGTACGQRYSQTIMGVAHKTLPCGTMVDFSYKGRTVRVPVIDRGPYTRGRMWDLSVAACKALNHCFTDAISYHVG